jgi:hypothetical protein
MSRPRIRRPIVAEVREPTSRQGEAVLSNSRSVGESVSKRSRWTGGVHGDAEVALLRPRLQPLTTEQRAEAVALLSDLLLAARLSDDNQELAGPGRASQQDALAA